MLMNISASSSSQALPFNWRARASLCLQRCTERVRQATLPIWPRLPIIIPAGFSIAFLALAINANHSFSREIIENEKMQLNAAYYPTTEQKLYGLASVLCLAAGGMAYLRETMFDCYALPDPEEAGLS